MEPLGKDNEDARDPLSATKVERQNVSKGGCNKSNSAVRLALIEVQVSLHLSWFL